MNLEDYIMEIDVQAWIDAHGYSTIGVYPTGEPWAEMDGTVYGFDISPDEFLQLLQASVDQDQDFISPHRVEEEVDEDSLSITVI